MHFAMPPRKTSRPPPYAARNQSSIPIPPALKNMLRRDKARALVLGLLGFLTIVWLLRHMGGGSGSSAAALIGTGAPVVIVTAFDPQANPVWVDKIKKNRDDYAKRHGQSWPPFPPCHMATLILGIVTDAIARLPDLLSYHGRLPSAQLPRFLDQGPRSTTRHVAQPWLHLVLVSG